MLTGNKQYQKRAEYSTRLVFTQPTPAWSVPHCDACCCMQSRSPRLATQASCDLWFKLERVVELFSLLNLFFRCAMYILLTAKLIEIKTKKQIWDNRWARSNDKSTTAPHYKYYTNQRYTRADGVCHRVCCLINWLDLSKTWVRYLSNKS